MKVRTLRHKRLIRARRWIIMQRWWIVREPSGEPVVITNSVRYARDWLAPGRSLAPYTGAVK